MFKFSSCNVMYCWYQVQHVRLDNHTSTVLQHLAGTAPAQARPFYRKQCRRACASDAVSPTMNSMLSCWNMSELRHCLPDEAPCLSRQSYFHFRLHHPTWRAGSSTRQRWGWSGWFVRGGHHCLLASRRQPFKRHHPGAGLSLSDYRRSPAVTTASMSTERWWDRSWRRSTTSHCRIPAVRLRRWAVCRPWHRSVTRPGMLERTRRPTPW